MATRNPNASRKTPAREQMIIRHMPLVTFVVSRMSGDGQRTLGLDREDAISYGIEGLIQAVDSFDPSRGTSFASFAIRRIRGAVLDAIRKADPLPRSVRRSAREIDQATAELAAQLGRWPTHRELALRLGISPDELSALQKNSGSRFVSLEQALQDRAGDGSSVHEPADEDELGNPESAAELQASMALLREALRQLPARDRRILLMRYAEQRPFHQIGEAMGLSESRVCQIHKRILATLRRRLSAAMEEAA
jgi:RNA polymerase sigma factor for flagellar operon FliA